MPSLGFVWAFVGASVIAALLTNGDGEIKKFGTCKISWGPSVTRWSSQWGSSGVGRVDKVQVVMEWREGSDGQSNKEEEREEGSETGKGP